jgi:hypothetical protein
MLRLLRWSPLLMLPLAAWGILRPEPPDPVVIPSAFRWKNSPWLEGSEEQTVTRNGIQRVYHKLLDIDWNPANGAHPVSFVPIPYQWRNYGHKRGNWTEQVELIPCIYITNNTFLKIGDAEVDELAHNLLRKLRKECPPTIQGVMLDCDWSAKTQARFFRLTRIMNDSLEVPLTATIRLHQYANPKGTGVPPADRGMLMPYNVGQITAPGDGNSIFDLAVAEPYFTSTKPYPLPLDIGLPAFSWGVQFRNGKFMGILQDAQVQTAFDHGMLSGETHGTLQVTKENNNAMPQLHLGDVIRVERMTPEVIAQVAQLARKAVNSDTLSVAYFEVGTGTFQRMDQAQVKVGYDAFGRMRTPEFPLHSEEEIVSEEVSIESLWIEVDSAAWSMPDSVIDVPRVEPKRKNER